MSFQKDKTALTNASIARDNALSPYSGNGKTSDVDFQLFFEASPHPYLILKPDAPKFTIVAVNESYLNATNTQRQAILGRGMFEVFPDNPDDISATGVSDLRISLERVIQERVQDVMGVQKYDIPRRGEGESGFEVKYWSPVNTPVFAEDKSVAFIIHRVEDVTEFMLLRERSSEETAQVEKVQAQAHQMEAEILQRAREVKEANRRIKAANEQLEQRERELAQLYERLQEVDQAKTAFFSNVSHEFRTPLTLLLGPVEEVINDPETVPRNRERMQVAHRNALRLQKLVNNLLDFARIEAGRIQASYQPMELCGITRELVSMFHSATEKAGIKLTVDCQPLPKAVYVDRDMWEKIVLNLLSNAFKHTFEGEIAVRLHWKQDHVELTVQDTGVGIPEEQLPHLFEKFYRVPNARSRTHEGSGIGLALVNELVKLHGGTIEVDSTQEQGTIFTVSIPTGKAHLPAEQIGGESEAVSPALKTQPFVEEILGWLPQEAREALPAYIDEQAGWIKPDGQKVRVAIVDDNADMRNYVSRLLEAHCQVETFSDGEVALEAARHNPPDLILSDIMMPKMDGFQLLSALRQDSALQTTPVILLSARAGEEARVEGLQAGADDYLVKPFNARELLARVKANLNLDLQRVRQEAEETAKTSEQQFRTLANSIAQLAWMAEPDGWIYWYNDRWYDYTGTTFEEMQGWGWEKVHHPDHIERVVTFVKEAWSKDEPWELTFPLKGKDGQYRWFLTRIYPVKDATGKVVRWIGTNTDIHEQKKTQEALQQTFERESALRKIAEINSSTLDTEFILEASAEEIGKLFQVDRCVVVRYREEVGKVIPDKPYQYLSSPGISPLQVEDMPFQGISATGRGKQDKHPMLFARYSNPQEYLEQIKNAGDKPPEDKEAILQKFQTYAHKYCLEAGLCIEIQYRGISYGAVLLHQCSQSRVWQEDEVILLEHIASNVGAVLYQAELYREEQQAKEEAGLRAKQQEVVTELGLQALSGIELQELMDTAVDMVAKTLDVEYCKILELLPGGQEVFLKAGVGWQEGLVGHATVSTGLDSQAGYTLISQEPVIVEDLRTETRFNGPPLLHNHGVISGMSLVIYTFGKPWGVMGTHATKHRKFSKQDVNFFQAVANVIATAIERKQIEQEKDRAKVEAETASRKKSEFLAMMSHELRTPLNSIIGYSRMIENGMGGPLTENQAKYIRNVSSSGNHLLNIVNDLLDVSKAEAGKMVISPGRIEIRPILDEIQLMVKELALKQHVSMDFYIEPEAEVFDADPARFKQIVINLVTNAIKFNRENGSVWVRFTRSEDKDWILGEIEDTGIGIPDDKKAELFKKFYQVDNTASRPQEGTGLGLALSRELIELHGGEISVESETGIGTTFRFKLPVSQKILQKAIGYER